MSQIKASIPLPLAMLLALFLKLPHAHAAPPQLIKDINTALTTNGSSPQNLAVVGSTVFFSAQDAMNGTELWKSDGTAAGTMLVKDIRSGSTASSPANLTVIGTTLYFTANDGSDGTELWKSDGTSAGTVLVKDIYSGTTGSGPVNLTVMGSTLYFTATDPANGSELWKSDGTATGTVLVKDIVVGSGDSSPSQHTVVGAALFFTATDSTHGTELWKSDGTTAGTVLVKDIRSGTSSSLSTNLTAVGSTLYFQANEGTNGAELWKSDGTAVGTVMVKDIRSGSGNATPTALTAIGSTLFFAATDGTNGNELWKSDGTTAGTVLMKDINVGTSSSTPAKLTAMGSTFFFTANNGTNGTELWKSDGTTAGTVLVKDINFGSTGSSPPSLLAVGSTLFLSALSSAGGYELWKSDGTSTGTVQVKDINEGSTSSAPSNLIALSSTLCFTADNGTSGVELWKSDGTAAGTVLVTDINTASSSHSNPSYLTLMGGTTYFSAYDAANGYELWKTDGTTAGTVLVKDINVGSSSSSPSLLTVIGGTLYFTASEGTMGSELWKSDGTTAGTVPVKDINSGFNGSNPTSLTVVGSKLCFVADDGTSGQQVWQSDGTGAGTVMIFTGSPGVSFMPSQLTAVGSVLYFTGMNSGFPSVRELWKFDGSFFASKVPQSFFNSNFTIEMFSTMTAVGSTLYFTASDGLSGAYGLELWKSDGNDIVLVKDILSGSAGSLPSSFIAVGSTLYFTAFDETSSGVWKSDGTSEGTVKIKEISISSPTVMGSTLYFTAFDGNGGELWKSDGTTAGTVMVKDISTGSGSSSPTNLKVVGSTLYFTATDGTSATQLWKSDGTAAGTVLVDDLASSSGISAPGNLIPVGNKLLFTATTAATGNELWGLNLIALAPEVATQTATNITTTAATLNGIVNPQGLTTTAKFDYGLTTSYSSTASVSLLPNDSTSNQNFSAALTGLSPGTTYHYRLSATNSIGTTLGTDQTFTTLSNVATLSSLVLDGGTLSPTFNSVTTGYTANVTVGTTFITPVVAQPQATVKVNGFTVAPGSASQAINLSMGSNTITTVVTAQDGTTTATYVITVNRSTTQSAIYNAATDVPVAANGYTATGNTVNFTLNYAPTTGTNLMVVKNSGPNLISGTFSNLAQGQALAFSFGGVTYHFVANYYGGTGNDLVLQWANTRPMAWGYNAVGQLGNNSTTQSTLPVAVTTSGALDGKTIMKVVAGYQHSLALCSDGSLASWGWNSWGQLGNNSITDSLMPVAVDQTGVLLGKTIIAVAAGDFHSLALCSDGTVAGWGNNSSGQLGNNNPGQSNVPVLVNTSGLPVNSVVAIAAGDSHSLALLSGGLVAAWGGNMNGQLGNGTTTNSSLLWTISSGALSGKTVVAVTAGFTHSLALCSDGSLATWGSNSSGQLGNNGMTDSSLPVAVDQTGVLAGKTVIAISAGSLHNVVLCSDGTLAAWGSNFSGQLGNDSTTQSNVPVLVTMAGVLAGKTIIAVSSGSAHSVALCSDNTLATWGGNSLGQLGNDSTTQSNVPVLVSTTPLAVGERFISGVSGMLGSHTLGLVAIPPAPPTPPTVTTLAATSVAVTTATLNGTVNANSNSTAVSFEYGTSTAYGATVAGTPTTLTGTSTTSVSAALTGLTPGTLYHCRVKGVSTPGTSNGTDQTFTTVSNVATLSGLTISSGTLSPAFDSGTTAYTANTTSGAMIITPTVTQSQATVKVNGVTIASGSATSPITLTTGNNTITTVVTAQDGTTMQTYTVTITRAPLSWTYNAITDVPVTTNRYTASGTATLTLNFTPTAGTTLTVVNHTGPGFISGGFSNLPQGQVVTLNYGGINYNFVPNYYGGTGNDLVLQWANNRAVAWGSNVSGQLGTGNMTDSWVPVPVNTSGVLLGKSVMSVAAGGMHSLALCSDGTLASWGFNGLGQLGNSSTTSSPVPVAVNTLLLSGKTSIAAGWDFNLAVYYGDAFAAWGSNFSGKLGNGTSTPGAQSSFPVFVNLAGPLIGYGKTLAAVAAGNDHSLLLCTDGTLFACGENGGGQLGNSTTTNSSAPVLVTSSGVLAGKTVTAIAAGGLHSLALCSDGAVVAWGSNNSGQLGNSSNTQSNMPVLVNTAGVLAGKSVIAIAAGSDHSLALCSDGTVVAWGSNTSGQLGNDSTTSSSVPVLVSTAVALNGKTVIALGTGSQHSLALCSDGTLTAWGSNASGQLGNNTTTQSLVPVVVNASSLLASERFSACTGGPMAGTHSLALVASPPFPNVTSLAATSVTSASATLNGKVNANSNSTSVSFDFGTTTNYELMPIVGTPTPLTGNSVTSVSAALTGLAPGTTYHYRVRAVNAAGTSLGTDQTFITADSPEIVVEQPAGTNLTDGSAIRYIGSAPVGSFVSETFTVKNIGTANLTNLGITLSGTNSDDFSVTTAPESPVVPGGSTTFVVRFTASEAGYHSAALHLASNDADENPFDITIVGTGRSTNANLSNLTLSAGTLTPSFAPGSLNYTATVPNATTSVTLSATRSDDNAAITINGIYGSSRAINLAVGNNTITTVVTAEDGTTTKTYTAIVTRSPSTNANLSSLALSAGTLNPTFASNTTSYTASVTNATSAITLTPTVADSTATVKVNNATVVSGNASGAISLAVGSTTITTVVTAEDYSTKTYTVTVTRPPSTNANLSNLTLSTGTLTPTFASNTTSYTATVTGATASITVTPTVADSTATVKVNDVPVPSGSASGPISLLLGSNTITTVVTAEDGTTTKTYTLTVTRTPSTNANLSDLALSAGTLTPTFASNTTSYTATVTGATASITVTPTVADSSATVKVNGVTVTSGTASQSITLAAGSNTLTTVVTAQDGTTTKTYTVTVTRPVSTNANLSNLALSAGTLTPTFEAGTTSYNASVSAATTTFTLNPTLADSNATVKVNGVTVASGSATPTYHLLIGANIITTVVTAEDGTTTKSYVVVVTRGTSSKYFLVADEITRSVLRLNATTGAANIYLAASNFMGSPQGMAIGPDGNLYVLDTVINDDFDQSSSRVLKFNTASGAFISTFVSSGIKRAYALAFDSAGQLYVQQDSSPVVVKYSSTGALIGGIVNTDIYSANTDAAIALGMGIGPDNRIYLGVFDTSTNPAKADIVRFNFNGTFIDTFVNNVGDANGYRKPQWDAQGNFYTGNFNDGVIRKFNGTTGALLQTLDPPGSGYAGMSFTPTGDLVVGSVWDNALYRMKTDGTDLGTFATSIQANDIIQQPATTPSNDANLSGLALSNSTLDPGFAAGTTSYATTVPYATNTITLTPTLADSAASVKVNNVTVASGSASVAIPLVVGSNTITTVVTAQDGSTKTYIVTVTRNAVGTNAHLNSIELSAGILSPEFDSDTTSYTANVSNGTESITFTPTTEDYFATVKVNNVAVVTGSPSGPINLMMGNNLITAVVKAEDGITTKTYTVTVTRTPLAPIITSALTATGVKGSVFAGYTVTATNSPTHFEALWLPFGLSINTSTGIISGTPLEGGTFNVQLIAENSGGTASDLLTLIIYDTNARLRSIELSEGTLFPRFDRETTTYTATVPNSTTSTTITPTTEHSFATVKVNNVNVTNGSPSGDISLMVGPNPITAVVTSSDGTTTKSYTVIVTRLPLPPVITGDLMTTAIKDRVFAGYTIAATNSPTRFNALGLPPGLSINTATGVISGTPTESGTFEVELIAENAGGTGTGILTLVINDTNAHLQSIELSEGDLSPGFNRNVTSYAASVSNSTESITFTPTTEDPLATVKINGVSVNAGSPSEPISLVVGSNPVTVAVKAADGITTKSYNVNIIRVPLPPFITSALTATGVKGRVFAGYTITATNSPTSFKVLGLPSGLSINTATGVISGTPTESGTFELELIAENAGGTGTGILLLEIFSAPSFVTSPQGGEALAGDDVELFVEATSTEPITYVWKQNGVVKQGISGSTLLLYAIRPEDAGSYVVVATNIYGSTTSTAAVVTVNIPPSVSMVPVTGAILQGQSTKLFVNATGTAPLSYQWYRGSLGNTSQPVGPNTNNLLTGALSTTTNFWVRVSSPFGSASAGPYIVTVNPPAPVISSPFTASVVSGQQFSYTINASNLPTLYGASALPNPLEINPTTGTISGIPTAAGTYTIGLSAKNVTGSGTATLTLTVLPPKPIITSALTTTGRVALPFSYPIQALNTPATYSVIGLPAGLTLPPNTSTITGTPTAAVSGSFEVRATNAGGTGSAVVAYTIAPEILKPVITSASTAAGRQGKVFVTFQVKATNSPTSFTAINLPAGLVFDTGTGEITGTPSVSGKFTASVSASNLGGTGAAQALVINIAQRLEAPVLNSLVAKIGRQGEIFSHQLTATNFPSHFAADPLPDGLILNASTGAITGTPTVNGTFGVAVTASNIDATSAVQNLTLTINKPRMVPVISNDSRVTGGKGAFLQFDLKASNSPTSYGSNGLPAGLSLNLGTGRITGTPTGYGMITGSVWATNGDGQGPTQTMVFDIAPPPAAPVISLSSASATAYVGQPFSLAIPASNAPTSFTAAPLPNGLTLASGGIIAGTPTTIETRTVSLTATNAGGTSTAVTLTIMVNAPPGSPVISNDSLPRGRVGTAYTATIAATQAPITNYTMSGLPAGLVPNVSSGQISGTPRVSGSFDVTLSGSNDIGTGAAKVIKLVIDPGPTAPVINSKATFIATQATPMTYQITTTDVPANDAPTSYDAVGLPEGLTLDPLSGLVTGAAVVPGTYKVTLTANNAVGSSTPLLLTLSVKALATVPRIITAYHVYGAYGQPFSLTLEATELPASRPLPTGYGFFAEGLPIGFSINSANGVISGANLNSGFSFTSYAKNEAGTGPKKNIFVGTYNYNSSNPIISGPLSLTGTQGKKQSFIVNTQYVSPAWIDYSGLTLYDVDGAYKNSWSIYSPSKAASDLTITFEPNITGRGTYSLYAGIIFSWSGNVYYGYRYNLPITVQAAPGAPQLNIPASASAQQGKPFSLELKPSQTNCKVWPITAIPTLPTGVQVTAQGVSYFLSGTPTVPGNYKLTLVTEQLSGTKLRSMPTDLILAVQPATAAGAAVASFAMRGERSARGIGLLSADEVNGTVGEDLDFTVPASGTPVRYEVSELPDGLAINENTGRITGQPTTPSSTDVTVVVYRELGADLPFVLHFRIAAAVGSPVVSSATTASAQVGVDFSYQITASGSPENYAAGSLPEFLFLDTQTGLITGIPTRPGVYELDLGAANAIGQGETRTLTLTVAAAAGTPVVTSAVAANAQMGQAFSFAVTATPAVTFFGSTELPFGLSFDTATGVISGTPTETGNFTPEVWGVNEAGEGEHATLTLSIANAASAPVMTSPTSINVIVGQPFSVALTATNSPTSFNSPPLPEWLSLDPYTGVLTGTAPEVGWYPLEFSANNNQGTSEPITVTLKAISSNDAVVEIAVEQPVGVNLADGDSLDFGNVGIGTGSVAKTFTIKNTGTIDLTGLTITKDGPDKAMFTVSSLPVSPVPGDGSTTFTVQVTPTTSGPKTAAIHIASNDADEASFDITLTATGVASIVPAVTTSAATGITFNGATLKGTVNAKGSDRAVIFDYGKTTSYGSSVVAMPSITGSVVTNVSAPLTNLLPHTKYNFRIRAFGALGSANGANLTFTTSNRAPLAVADSALALPSAKVTIPVLTNDSDPDGDTLSILSFTQPGAAVGTVAKAGTDLVFTAAATFAGGSFAYTTSDGFGGKTSAIVTITRGACELSPASASVAAVASDYLVFVTATDAWSVNESLNWATVTPTSGTGDSIVTVKLLGNTAKTSRSGVLTIGGQSHSILQAGTQGFAIESPAPVPAGMVSADYTLTIPALLPLVKFSASGLPTGLGIHATSGLISGKPKESGTFKVMVTGSTTTGISTTISVPLMIAPLPTGAIGSFSGPIARAVALKDNDNLGGRIDLTTTATGSLTGKIILGAASYTFPTTAVLNATVGSASPTALFTIARKAPLPALTVSFTIDSANNTLTDGDIFDGVNHTTFQAWRKVWATPGLSTTDQASLNRYLGLHTFALQAPSGQPALPQGSGYGSFTVAAKTGALTAAGKLADNTAFTCSTFAGPHGEVLIYNLLHSNKGSILGKLTITPGTSTFIPPYGDNSLTGAVNWLRPTLGGRLYPNAIGPYDLAAVGGRYVPPVAPALVLGITDNLVNNGRLLFSGADIINVSPDIAFRLKAGSVLVPPLATSNTRKTTLVATASSGYFTGSFSLSDPNAVVGTAVRPATYYGQIVRDTDGVLRGYGFFVLADLPAVSGETVNNTKQKSGQVIFEKSP